MNNFFILVTYGRRLSMKWINCVYSRYDTFILKIYLTVCDVVSFKTLLLFLLNLVSKYRTLSKTCCYCPVIQSLYLCNILVLVQYLSSKIHIEIYVNCSRVKVIFTHKKNIFARAITMQVLSILASYSIFETWTVRRRCVLLFGLKGQRSANLLLLSCTSVLKECLKVPSSQILPSLYKDAGWYKEDVK